MADQVAMAMFESPFGVRDVEQVSIVISYGYDIMISHVRTTKAFVHSPGEWLKRLGIDDPTRAAPQVSSSMANDDSVERDTNFEDPCFFRATSYIPSVLHSGYQPNQDLRLSC
ncbi:MAG: hypothetical protein H8K10_18750 [Nitrospira sp.]|nr:hypothetical protein [Nitrospira sp.]